MRFRSSLRHWAAALFVVLLSFGVFGGAAHAQTIENIAEARWTFGGNPFETESNLVSLEVDPAPSTIDVFRPATGSDTVLDFRSSFCAAPGVAGAASTAAESQLQSLNVEETSQVSAGTSIFFRVSVPQANVSPNSIDELEARLVSSTGDRETIIIYETGEDTGIFVGTIATHRVQPPYVSGDCVLGVVDAGYIHIGVARDGSTDVFISAAIDVVASPFNYVLTARQVPRFPVPASPWSMQLPASLPWSSQRREPRPGPQV